MIDLLSPDVLEDPYPTYNRIREEHPLLRMDDNVWMLSRYADVKKGLSDYQLFTSEGRSELFTPSWIRADIRPDFFIANVDPPKYQSKRTLISTPFVSHRIKKLELRMIDAAKTFSGEMISKGNAEFLRDFAFPYIAKILGYITGLDNIQPLEATYNWIKAVEQAMVPEVTARDKKRIEASIIEQRLLFEKIVREKRINPTDDIISELATSGTGDERLTTLELMNIIELLVRAGFQSTVHLLAISVLQLIDRPDLRAMLVNSSDLTPRFVDEVLRLYSSVPIVFRHVTRDLTLYEETIPEGATVWFCISAANRDPRKFSSPDNFDMKAGLKSEHIGFGFGPHLCMGQHLARLEISTALKQLLPFIERMECPTAKNLKWIRTVVLRGLEELPIKII